MEPQLRQDREGGNKIPPAYLLYGDVFPDLALAKIPGQIAVGCDSLNKFITWQVPCTRRGSGTRFTV